MSSRRIANSRMSATIAPLLGIDGRDIKGEVASSSRALDLARSAMGGGTRVSRRARDAGSLKRVGLTPADPGSILSSTMLTRRSFLQTSRCRRADGARRARSRAPRSPTPIARHRRALDGGNDTNTTCRTATTATRNSTAPARRHDGRSTTTSACISCGRSTSCASGQPRPSPASAIEPESLALPQHGDLAHARFDPEEHSGYGWLRRARPRGGQPMPRGTTARPGARPAARCRAARPDDLSLGPTTAKLATSQQGGRTIC